MAYPYWARYVSHNPTNIKTTYHKARSEHAGRVQQVDVVAARVVLCESDDGSLQAYVTVVVRAVLRGVPRELRDLDVGLEVALEGGKHNLALPGFQTVHQVGDGPLQVSAGEQDQLLQTKLIN
jgi:hypothetical protein